MTTLIIAQNELGDPLHVYQLTHSRYHTATEARKELRRAIKLFRLTPEGQEAYGSNGMSFDWDILTDYVEAIRKILPDWLLLSEVDFTGVETVNVDEELMD